MQPLCRQLGPKHQPSAALGPGRAEAANWELVQLQRLAQAVVGSDPSELQAALGDGESGFAAPWWTLCLCEQSVALGLPRPCRRMFSQGGGSLLLGKCLVIDVGGVNS